MIRLSSCASRALAAVPLLVALVTADSARGQKPSVYELLPDSVQAVVWVPDGNALADGWNETQLAKLAKDPAVAPFFDEQRQAIETRFVDAGWRLNVKPGDLSNFLTGQVAIAWLELPNVPRKPFAMSLIAEVDDDAQKNTQLMEKVDAELKRNKATRRQLDEAGVEISHYTLPVRAGELLAQHTYYAVTGGSFFATDDETLIRGLIQQQAAGKPHQSALSADADFIKGRELLELSGNGHLEYFVRPLGFARVLRSIGGKRSKSDQDMLAVLKNQGFDAIRCVCGEIQIGDQQVDLLHRGYVLADNPLPVSVQILDFPNEASHSIPKFVGEKISSLVVTNWNAAEAFWKAEGLVDEIAGTEGVFQAVIDGIREDPSGSQIDIKKDVLPHFTNDIYAITDNKDGPADVDSRRNLIALKVTDADKLAKVINRVMMNEPDTERVEFEGHGIWQVLRSDDADLESLEFGDDFGPAPIDDEEQAAPWLSEWAITVYDDYLLFASHVGMIEDAIAQNKRGVPSPLLKQQDFQRSKEALEQFLGEQAACAWQVVRTDQAYRIQYELFREGKLKQSQSMIASILDRLLQNNTEIKSEEQRVDGKSLPPFEQIAKFLQPSAMMTRTTDSGWQFGSLLLASPAADGPTLEVSDRSETDTARATELQLK